MDSIDAEAVGQVIKIDITGFGNGLAQVGVTMTLPFPVPIAALIDVIIQHVPAAAHNGVLGT